MLIKRSSSARSLFLFVWIITIILFAGILVWSATHPTIPIHWGTESELDVTGYNLYRSDQPDGAFRKINPELLPPAADPFLSSDHRFVDTNVRWGQNYYYQLETIKRDGRATRSDVISLRASFRLLTP